MSHSTPQRALPLHCRPALSKYGTSSRSLLVVMMAALLMSVIPARALHAQGSSPIPVAGLEGLLQPASGQIFQATFAFPGSKNGVALYGRSPAVENSIALLLKGGQRVLVWGTYYPAGRFSTDPEIVADDIAQAPSSTPTQLPTPTPLPVPTSTPSPPVSGWKSSFWANTALVGQPVLVRGEAALNFNWGNGSPDSGIPADGFSSRFEIMANKPAGWYRVSVTADDGARVWMNSVLLIDNWENAKAGTVSAETYLAGPVDMRVEHFDNSGPASVSFAVREISAPARPTPTPVAYPNWKSSYFANNSLSGSPVLVRNEAAINMNWGNGSPASGIPVDNFSAMFEGKLERPAGWYSFSVTADDGFRLFLDNELILDGWQERTRQTATTVRFLDGSYPIRLDYMETTDLAGVSFAVAAVAAPGQPPTVGLPPIQGMWAASYFNGRTFAGAPVVTAYEQAGQVPLDRYWGPSSPVEGINPDYFAVNYQGSFPFQGRAYTFSLTSNDGGRILIDGQTILDAWQDGRNVYTVRTEPLREGYHTITVQLYEVTENAYVTVTWK